MILGHVFGIPVEENFAQLAPAAAVFVSLATLAGRAMVEHLRTRARRR
jgi:hypothetical protein